VAMQDAMWPMRSASIRGSGMKHKEANAMGGEREQTREGARWAPMRGDARRRDSHGIANE
jgi:hypothetical protein